MALCRGLIFVKAHGDILILEWPLWDWTVKEEAEILQFLKTVADWGKSVIISSTKAPSSPLIDHMITVDGGIKTGDENSRNTEYRRETDLNLPISSDR